ncbi:MAG TPA: TetR family transcriptional regulator [Candidatus Dormibacteraeota bacterium]|nr:TetR family transcriptional regulator [Candidatus Dormibacteraeota bacterium]
MPRLAVEEKEARRRHILSSALRCFARRGYHATTVEDIAAEAGVSKGAPYVYFDSKEALFQQLYDSWDCGLAARIDAAIAGIGDRARSPRGVLEAVIAAVGDHVTEEADLCRVLVEARAQAAYARAVAERVRSSDADAQTRMAQLIQAGIARGEWQADADPELHARLILAAIDGLMAQWHVRPGSFSWQDAATALAGGWSE